MATMAKRISRAERLIQNQMV